MSGSDGKTCPACAEEVKLAAKICRFCRYDFETGAADGAANDSGAPAAPSVAPADSTPVASTVAQEPATGRKRHSTLALTIAIYALLTGLGMALGIFVFDRMAEHPEPVEETAAVVEEQPVVAQGAQAAKDEAIRQFEKAIDTFYSGTNSDVQTLAAEPAARISVNLAMEMFGQPGGGLVFRNMERQERETLAVWAATARSAGTDGKDLVVGATMDGSPTIRSVWSGEAQQNDRVMPAILLEADLPLVNAVAGRRQTACLRRLSVIDQEFGMERAVSYLPCGQSDLAIAKAMKSAGVIDIPPEYGTAIQAADGHSAAPSSMDGNADQNVDFSDITSTPAPAARSVTRPTTRPAAPALRNRSQQPTGVIAMTDADDAGHAAEAAATAARAAAQVPTKATRGHSGADAATEM
ncbi:zinc ribbon domain-containing protein [Croceibacterium xixiisoli]|uniref:zinc ribbon domain-containing protein n=1 Tax=Croceibacterium xixiisoli TaxID=1476466 RepID=UPI0019259D77|nr:zinc ribbon domain-containing protein [Croceibacterium xixiisoli]